MTAQMHERLILDGVQTSMAFCPPLPDNHPRIVPRDGLSGSPFIFSTACWRRYLGTWEVRDGRFYLIEVTGSYQLAGNEPLFADWFSGTLRVPQGELVDYVHMGFGSTYERDLLITIDKGLVVSKRVLDNRNPNVGADEPEVEPDED